MSVTNIPQNYCSNELSINDLTFDCSFQNFLLTFNNSVKSKGIIKNRDYRKIRKMLVISGKSIHRDKEWGQGITEVVIKSRLRVHIPRRLSEILLAASGLIALPLHPFISSFENCLSIISSQRSKRQLLLYIVTSTEMAECSKLIQSALKMSPIEMAGRAHSSLDHGLVGYEYKRLGGYPSKRNQGKG